VERFLLYKLLDKCKEHEVDVYIQNTEERWREFLLLKNNAGGIPVIKSVEIGENDYGSIYDDMNNAMVLIDKYFVRNKRTRKLFGYGIMNTIKKIIKKVKNFFKKNDRTKK
jgi:NADP-dependent 3-hydroxy acid dehydrogenase YdfG